MEKLKIDVWEAEKILLQKQTILKLEQINANIAKAKTELNK